MPESQYSLDTFTIIEHKKVFKTPRTTTEDYLKYRTEYMEIVGRYANRRVGLIETKLQFILLSFQFRSRISRRDYFEFDDLTQMDRFLERMGAPEDYRSEIKEHEGDHIKAATSLGYETTIGLWRTREPNGV